MAEPARVTPKAHPTFSIVGVSDSIGYSQNPCLAQEKEMDRQENTTVSAQRNPD